MQSNILKTIKQICKSVTDNQLDQLRIEEELLLMLVKSKKHSLTIKSDAFKSIKAINETQLAILGHALERKEIKPTAKLNKNIAAK